jgi:hypothetical protein
LMMMSCYENRNKPITSIEAPPTDPARNINDLRCIFITLAAFLILSLVIKDYFQSKIFCMF